MPAPRARSRAYALKGIPLKKSPVSYIKDRGPYVCNNAMRK